LSTMVQQTVVIRQSTARKHEASYPWRTVMKRSITKETALRYLLFGHFWCITSTNAMLMLDKKYYRSQAVGHFYGSTYISAYILHHQRTYCQ
ncbi:hypothetical protein T11_12516, partial [Trichinella zimbabwensis]